MKIDEIEKFVILCYKKYLKRNPDENGLRSYISDIKSGKIRCEDLPKMFLESEEFKMKSTYSDLWKPHSFEDAKQLILSSDGSTPSTNQFAQAGMADANYISTLVKSDFNIVDYGCGVGRIAKFLCDKVRTIHAVDISSEMLKFAEEFCKDCNNIKFVLTNGNKISLKDSSIDFAYSVLALQHVEKEDAFLILEELHRILKLNCKVYLTFPDITSDVYWSHFEMYAFNTGARTQNRTRMYTVPEVEMMLKKSGFHIVDIPSHSSHKKEENIRVIAEKT